MIDIGAGTFAPAAGDSFEFLTAGDGIEGQFSSELPLLASGLKWVEEFTSDSLTLNVAYILPADFDGNGIVDERDMVNWDANYGGVDSTRTEGDANDDRLTDGRDFLEWQLQFGQSLPLAASIASVPEPLAASLMLLALLCAAVGRNANRH